MWKTVRIYFHLYYLIIVLVKPIQIIIFLSGHTYTSTCKKLYWKYIHVYYQIIHHQTHFVNKSVKMLTPLLNMTSYWFYYIYKSILQKIFEVTFSLYFMINTRIYVCMWSFNICRNAKLTWCQWRYYQVEEIARSKLGTSKCKWTLISLTHCLATWPHLIENTWPST